MEDFEEHLLSHNPHGSRSNTRSLFYVLLLLVLGLSATIILLIPPSTNISRSQLQIQLKAPAVVRIISKTTNPIYGTTKPTQTTYNWDAEVSLRDSDRESILSDSGEIDVRAWLYYKTMHLSTAQGKFYRGPEGGEMRMNVSFTIYSKTLTGIKEEFEDDFMANQFLMFDVLMEGDVKVNNPGSWLRKRRASVIIDCNDVKIQYRGNNYGGFLGGDKRCESQIVPGKLEDVYKKRDLRIVSGNFV